MSDMAILSPREFTVAEYHRMADIGLFRDDERVELLDGIIVEMSPIGTRHWRRHATITAYLNRTLGDHAFIVPQGSFPLGDKNEPQPDIAVLARECADAENDVPLPAQIYALIEISDSSLAKDLGPKQRLYARFGIADYVVVDLNENVLLHYREPHELGYGICDRLFDGDAFELAALPGITLRTDALLK
jgi:Uma2 family endonuclease